MSRLTNRRTLLSVLAIMLFAKALIQPTGGVTQAAPNKLVVAYVSGWGTPTRTAAAALDGTKYSILIYAFIGIDPATNSCTANLDGILSAATMADVVQGLKDNKAENASLKVLLSIGGAGYESKFEALTNYTTFANSCYDLVTQYGVDGIDVDYEFPENSAESTRMNGILSAMHTKFNNNGSGTGTYIVTVGAAASYWYAQWQDAATLKNYVDYFTTMAYNYHGGWESTLNYNSAGKSYSGCGLSNLATNDSNCAEATASYWNSTRGVPKSKILVGLGYYGNRYTTTGGCSSTPGTTGFTAYDQIDYATMRTNGMLSGSATAGSGWTRNYSTTVENSALCKSDTWIGYEDPTSAAWRANWLEDNGYPGIMIWEVSKDHNSEMINSINDAFGNTVATNTPTATRTNTPSGCSYPTWSSGGTYHLNDIVYYAADGNYYKAVNEDANGPSGTDPTISTWYWDPHTCVSSTNTPTYTPTRTHTPATCSYPNWAAGTNYVTGNIVKYVPDGNYYIAEHDNPGYDPIISTWFWDPYTCTAPSATNTPTPTNTATNTPTPTGPSNLAQGKTTTHSNTCNANETSSKAVNGTWNGGNTDKWCDNSSAGTAKWMTIDLGANYALTQFVIKHAGAGGESTVYNTKDFNIQVSSDNTNWATVVNVTGNTASDTTHNISATNGRYIKLNVTAGEQSGSTARIYEVLVYGGTARTNIALNDVATASGPCQPQQGAAKANNGTWIDGNDKWCDTQSATKYWQVDLGSSQSINQIQIYHAGVVESTVYNTKDFNIQVSTNGTSWTTIVTVTSNTANYTIHNFTTASARYVRLNVTAGAQSSNGARIYEVQVY